MRGKREEERKGPPNKSALSCHHYVSTQLVSASALFHADLPCRLATFHPTEVEILLLCFASIAHSFSLAKQQKKAWIETVKIKNRCKIQKRREAVLSSHSRLGGNDGDSETTQDTHGKKTKTNHAEGNATIANKEKQQSLRDLFRKAYSKESLHTYKSDPLKKRKGGRQQGTGRRGNAAPSRGQPNMKLRMNAMLEKIKQDYS